MKGMHICFEGAQDDKLFVVQEGEVQLEKSLELDVPSQLHHCLTSSTSKRSRSLRRNIVVSIVSSSSIIGEEIIVDVNRRYSYTCTVLSPTAIILIADAKSIH